MVTSMLSGRKLPITLAFLVMIVFTFGVSCRGFFVKPTLSSITVTPLTPTIATGTTGNTVQMAATGTFDDGSSGSTPVQWSVSPDSFATISASGLVTAVATGSATITATSLQTPTISGTQPLTVTVGCIQSIKIQPSSGSLTPNSPSFSFSAMATTCNGTIDITSVAVWTSSNTTIATVSAGVVTATASAGANGQITISASSGGVTSNPNATVNVTGF